MATYWPAPHASNSFLLYIPVATPIGFAPASFAASRSIGESPMWNCARTGSALVRGDIVIHRMTASCHVLEHNLTSLSAAICHHFFTLTRTKTGELITPCLYTIAFDLFAYISHNSGWLARQGSHCILLLWWLERVQILLCQEVVLENCI